MGDEGLLGFGLIKKRRNPGVVAVAKGFFSVLPILARTTIFLGALKQELEKEGICSKKA